MGFKEELYNIKAIDIMPSIMKDGILSYEEVKKRKLPHISIAMPEVQEKRDAIRVPNALRLHNYANLYFDARNPMMFKHRGKENSLCVLTISAKVLDISGVVLTDRNASSKYARFLSTAQIEEIDFAAVYGRDWTHKGNQAAYFSHKSQKCAEVLIPDCVPPQYILSAHVVNSHAKEHLKEMGFNLDIIISPDMFFC